MRSILLAATLSILHPLGALAAGSITQPGTWTADTSGGGFVQSDFMFELSSGVFLAAEENANAIVVGTVSPKGNFYYTGMSGHGAIRACGDKFTVTPTQAVASIAEVNNNGCSF